jgi:ubiquinone/menaquinone biosynthesis C-methylase UbiE
VAEALDVQPEDRVLDVACGGGWFLDGFASTAASVAGVDLSPLQIQLAERRLRDRVAAGSAELVVGDATALPWEPDTFTAVTCMGSLEWFDDPGAALAEMHRVLQPGGRLVLGLGPLAEPGEPADRTSQAMGIAVWTEPELRELLAAAGFADVEATAAGEVVVVRAPR